jgi:hypothetical protein
MKITNQLHTIEPEIETFHYDNGLVDYSWLGLSYIMLLRLENFYGTSFFVRFLVIYIIVVMGIKSWFL